MADELERRFWEKVAPEPNSGCWLWLGGLNDSGYGRMTIGRNKNFRAHRWAYLFYVGSIPPGLELDHKCRVRSCVNPAHLEPVTHLINSRRGQGGKYQTLRTHCPHGHPYDSQNTKIIDGKRKCLICMRGWQRLATKRYKLKRRSSPLQSRDAVACPDRSEV